VGGVLLQGRLREHADQRPHRPGLLEPAQGHGGGAPVLRLVVGEGGEKMVDEALPAQGGLHRGVEALPAGGGPLLDGDDGLDRHVPQERVGIVEMRDEPGQRLPAGQPAQGFHGGTAQELVAEQLQQRRRRLGIADLAQRPDRRVLQPRLGAQHLHEGQHRLRVADLTQARGRRVPHVDVGIPEGGDEPLHRAPLAARAEHHRGEVAYLLVDVVEQIQQRLARAGAQLDVDLHGGVAHRRVVVVAEGGLQPGEQRALVEGDERVRGGLAHRPALVGHRHQQGQDGLRLPGAAHLRHHPPPHGFLAGAQRLQRRLYVERHGRIAFKRGGRGERNGEDAETRE